MSASVRTAAICAVLVLAPLLLLPVSQVTAGVPPGPEFERTWARTDFPVIEGVVPRTWIWGPGPNTEVLNEPNFQAPAGTHTVQYYDKARMEIPDPNADPNAPGYVRTGLLVTELISGRIQIGDNQFRNFSPSLATVAGDLDDPNGMTYETVGTLLDLPPFAAGTVLTTRVSPDGSLSDAPEFAVHGVTADHYVAETDHRIASVFWEFMNSSGTVWNGVEYVNQPLFPEPFFATGLPITEAYWLRVRVAGVEQDVLLQCFERRCLTYTPSNPDGWKVESNNVGIHYFDWRYNQLGFDDPVAEPEDPAVLPDGLYVTDDGQSFVMWLEVAATDATRACGLMHRDSLPIDVGMLFVWDEDQTGSFWNCNTFIPLTLAWISADGIILGLTDMEPQVRGEPQNVVSYPPPGPYRYVVEANQGWFEFHGIDVGDRAFLEPAIGIW